MKRKAESHVDGKKATKKKSKTTLAADEAQKRFRDGLFKKDVLDSYTSQYATSAPYKHAVIDGLVNDKLLRAVREEIRNNVSFTPKETDIYKIHQSGDLANLDGLDDESLAKLPSLLALRDAVYSETFRDYVSHITGCGPLSGSKTDMAINVYTPGCYLLCHDDVIGSRRVSYILYLTDPDTPWKPEWGGALRLFPTLDIKGADGAVAKTPLPDAAKVIPPAWNQLSFFAVQPGESFHDVEEVYHPDPRAAPEEDGGRVRMAISGWFHIPQIGEPGYIKGEEERNAKNSSLMQLQGNPAQYDLPQSRPVKVERFKPDEADFSEADLEFLLQYMAPRYLVPDTLEQVLEHFEENSSITLPNILSRNFKERLETHIGIQDSFDLTSDVADIESTTPWKVSRPPHKHRYLYQHPSGPGGLLAYDDESPITELLDVFLPSRQFRQWLQMATGSTVESHDLIARRFRRGRDYTLATGHEGKPRLELNLGITPPGWGDDDSDDDEAKKKKGTKLRKGKGKAKAVEDIADKEDDDVGGHEVYMAGDDDDDEDEDAAVYKSSGDDDNILFFQGPAWNKLTLVLRDSGTLKFVKYVSNRAPGDRFDISGVFEVKFDDDEEEDADGDETNNKDESEEEEFKGFSDAPESDSD